MKKVSPHQATIDRLKEASKSLQEGLKGITAMVKDHIESLSTDEQKKEYHDALNRADIHGQVEALKKATQKKK